MFLKSLFLIWEHHPVTHWPQEPGKGRDRAGGWWKSGTDQHPPWLLCWQGPPWQHWLSKWMHSPSDIGTLSLQFCLEQASPCYHMAFLLTHVQTQMTAWDQRLWKVPPCVATAPGKGPRHTLKGFLPSRHPFPQLQIVRDASKLQAEGWFTAYMPSPLSVSASPQIAWQSYGPTPSRRANPMAATLLEHSGLIQHH